MKWLSLSLFILLLTSCSRFSTPHYRKLKLVPAQENSFSVSSIADRESILSSSYPEFSASVDRTITDPDTLNISSGSADTLLSGTVIQFDEVNETFAKKPERSSVESNNAPPIPMRRDWSVFIAILLLFAGVMLLLWSIAIFFTIPAAFWIRLLIGIGMFPLAIRMILLGARILANRWRNPVNYKESER